VIHVTFAGVSIRGGSKQHNDPMCLDHVESCALPIQVMVPSSGQLDPLQVDKLQFQFELRWDKVIPMTRINDTWMWEAQIDCEFAASSHIIYVSFSSHPADDYELECNHGYVIDVASRLISEIVPF
jgi:hypothetical protein